MPKVEDLFVFIKLYVLNPKVFFVCCVVVACCLEGIFIFSMLFRIRIVETWKLDELKGRVKFCSSTSKCIYLCILIDLVVLCFYFTKHTKVSLTYMEVGMSTARRNLF